VVVDLHADATLESERTRIADQLPLATDDHHYEVDDLRFLEAMAFYWIESSLDQLDALGYQDLIQQQVQVEAHAKPLYGTFPASAPDAYVDAKDHLVLFMPWGDQLGGAAEDADIIIHEYGHIVHVNAAPDIEGDWFGIFAEGTADLFAATIVRDHSDGYGDDCIFEWLATRYPSYTSWDNSQGLRCLRVLDNDFVVGEDDLGENPHHTSQFWTGPAWQIMRDMPPADALALLVEAVHLMPAKPTSYGEFGAAFVEADRVVAGGVHVDALATAYAAHNIVLPDDALAGEDITAASTEPADVPGLPLWSGLAALGLVALAARQRRS